MEFLTAKEVANILRCSLWFVYKNYKELGGIRFGKIIRFEKEAFLNNIKEGFNDDREAQRETPLQFLVEGSETQEGRLQDEARSPRGRAKSSQKSKTDKYGLYRLVREQT